MLEYEEPSQDQVFVVHNCIAGRDVFVKVPMGSVLQRSASDLRRKDITDEMKPHCENDCKCQQSILIAQLESPKHSLGQAGSTCVVMYVCFLNCRYRNCSTNALHSFPENISTEEIMNFEASAVICELKPLSQTKFNVCT